MTVDELWASGRLRAAVELSAAELAHGHPFRDVVAGDDLATAAALHAHGSRCWYVARYADAQDALERAFAIRAAGLGPEHVDTLATSERLAAVAHKRRDYDGARARWQEVIPALRGTDDVRLGIALRNFSAFLRSRGELADARAAIDDALHLLGDLPDADDELFAARKAEAMLCVEEGKHGRALDRVAAALERSSLVEEHPFVAGAKLIAVRALGKVHAKGEREPLFADIIASYERAFDTHPLLALALNLASKYSDAGVDIALDRARRAYTIYRSFYPPPNPTTESMARRLYNALVDAGRDAEAAALEGEMA